MIHKTETLPKIIFKKYSRYELEELGSLFSAYRTEGLSQLQAEHKWLAKEKAIFEKDGSIMVRQPTAVYEKCMDKLEQFNAMYRNQNFSQNEKLKQLDEIAKQFTVKEKHE